ncbi:uncharacterized protein TRUGW13939_08992 [Talaromyces rugulosus]|uniref:Suppressor of anucleate metulae protein B n=1 Tax=Talaromyces rugulosus TaxID=121627 RepID=A0A7H8R6K4_TALRU|nr:uncharacterized protein TRUGW13939_08992 [Talaromyces rugulosus]QKX61836.1 hypothetical protein TRUGW13939_08992 [Talaromyces rugulosus]
MEESPRLQKEISDLVNILSLITKRDSRLEKRNSEPRQSEIACSEDDRIDLSIEEEEGVDEAEFEAPDTSREAEVDAIKRNTLDRLAEVLARFKTANASGPRGKQNWGAKHVTSVIMMENLDGKSVTFLCAKNEGLDGRMARVKDDQPEQLDQVFDAIFDHQGPRVKHYSTMLRKAIERADHTVAPPKTLTSRNVKEGLSQVTSRDWEDENGLQFRFRVGGEGEESISDKSVGCLSDQEEENLVQEVYSEIRRLFGNNRHEFLPIPMKNFLKKVYRVVRHPRQRPALKGLLRQTVHNDNRLFKQAWDSVLYLTRIFYAAATFMDLATKLRPVSIKFQQVPVAVVYRPRIPDRRSPTEVLKSLGHSALPRTWRDFFQTSARVEKFNRLSGLRKTVHGEVQLILHVELMYAREELNGKHGTFQARGTHETLFPLWALPQILPQQSFQILLQFTEILRKFLRKSLNQPYPPPQRDLLRQSSAALSTAKAVQREAPTYSIRPETLRKLMLGPGGVSASEHQVEFLPSPEEPGYATLMGGLEKQKATLVPVEEAEMAKIKHERRTSMFELIDEMPHTRFLDQKPCRSCPRAAEYRCSACWTWCCSKACQRRNWALHVFVCRVPNRPNDMDFLRLGIRRFTKNINSGGEEQSQEWLHDAMIYMLADDHICRTFGFNSCENTLDVLNLACLYSTMLFRVHSPVTSLHKQLETGNLGNFMERFCQLERSIAQVTNTEECDCVTWFLSRRSSESLLIPNVDKTTYDIWVVAEARAIESLDLAHRFDNGYRLSNSQVDVFHLYVANPANRLASSRYIFFSLDQIWILLLQVVLTTS